MIYNNKKIVRMYDDNGNNKFDNNKKIKIMIK